MKRAGDQMNADPNSNERVSDKAEKKEKGNQLAGQSIDESGKLKCLSSSKQEDQPEYLKQKIRTLEEQLDITVEDGIRNKKVVQLLLKFISDLRQEDAMSDAQYKDATNNKKTYEDDILDNLRSRIKDQRLRIIQMQSEKDKYQQLLNDRDQRIQDQFRVLQHKETYADNLKRELQKTKNENGDLILRLSKLAAARLTKDNPNIADLSDTNRPTKIAERYSELYDNEWKDAYEEFLVKKNMEEVQCVQSLVDLLKATYDACVQLTKPNREMLKTLTCVFITLNCDLTHTKQSAGIQDHSFARSTSPDTALKMDENIKDNDRSIAEEKIKDRVTTIPKGFTTNVDTGKVSTEVVIDVKFSEEEMRTISDMRRLSAIRFETEKNISKLIAEKIAFERGIETKKMVKVMAFITKCAELCWYMAIQEPPVVIEFHEPVDDELFDKDKYKEYTEMGEKLDYVVWPPLFLYSGGARLFKGTAQGKK